MRRRRWLTVPLLVVALVVTGCYRWTTDQFVVTGKAPANVLVVLHRHPTNQIEFLYFTLNQGSPSRTLDTMSDFVWSAAARSRLAEVGLAISDFDYFFERVQASDFQGAVFAIRNNSRCLALDRSWNPFSDDRHNWTYREHTDRHCLIGVPFPLK